MLPDAARWHIHKDAATLNASVADAIAVAISSAIALRSKALIAVPGGKTPGPIFTDLATRDVNWAQVTLIPGDERLVADDSPLCNYSLISNVFLPLGATVLPLVNGPAEKVAAAAALAANADLDSLDWPADLVWLGMGGDGHTASIFPGPDLHTALFSPAHFVGVTPDPLPLEAPVSRLTLTAAEIARARSLLVVITGAAKRAVLESALADGEASLFPIGKVLAGAASVDIHWRAD